MLLGGVLHAVAERPNVVFILSDNQSYWEFGCHGNPVVKTPNVDRLAAESVDFRRFYATPYCSPSRAEFLTGRYAMRFGVYNTVGGVSQLPGEALTMAEIFRDHGYRTGMFGKWHLGESYPMRPEDQGFDEAFWHGGGGVGQLPDHYGNTLFDTTFTENDRPVPTTGFCTDRIFDRAIRFLREHRDRRFFCYVPTPVTHKPWAAPDEYKRPYEALGMKPGDAAGYGQMTNLDENIGRLLRVLDELKLRENTVLVFATDQGMGREAPAADMSLPQIRGGHRGYDWANHVAFMIRYPARIRKTGRVQEQFAGAVDLLPTLATWCRLDSKAISDGHADRNSDRNAFDGISLAPFLEDSARGWPEARIMITQCPRSRTPRRWQNAVVRRGPWRLTGPQELFHALDDPRQRNNIAAKHPEIVARLGAAYDRWWSEFEADQPGPARAVLGNPERPEVRLTSMDWYRGANPWQQGNLRRGKGKGTWAVRLHRAGRYRVELRRYPREADKAVGGVSATVEFAGKSADAEISKDARAAVFHLDLPAGDHDFTGGFKGADGKDIGAFFAHVRRVE